MALYSDGKTPISPSTASPPLARKISLACGPLHTRLNNAIVSSMPLALPPKAKDTRLYAAGLASFGMIYLTYEDLWHTVANPSNLYETDIRLNTSHEAKVASFFATLRPSGIERSPQIRNDLAYLATTDEPSQPSTSSSSKEGPAQKRFRKHIQRSLAMKPHTLYAYAWCMYMAVFAGGRYIREDLANAGEKFWRNHGHPPPESDSDSTSDSHSDSDSDTSSEQEPEQDTPSTPTAPLLPSTTHTTKNKKHKHKKPKPSPLDRKGYTFLSFGTSDDGAAIRDTFIDNLHAAEKLFTSAEQDDVVAESRSIFELTIDLVDEMARTIKPSTSMSSTAPSSTPSRLPPYHTNSPPPYTYTPPYSHAATLSKHNDLAYAPLLTQRASTPELLEWSRDPDPPRHGFVFWSNMAVLVIVSMLIGWGLLFGVRLWLWHLAGQGRRDRDDGDGTVGHGVGGWRRGWGCAS